MCFKNWARNTVLSTYSVTISTEKEIIFLEILIFPDCLEMERNVNKKIMEKIQS